MLSVVMLPAICYGQVQDSLFARYKIDFAVPDMPAFKALGTDPDNLMRPSDPKALALMLADATSNFRVIPQSFAAEFAPWRLFGSKKLTMGDYLDHQFLYDARASLGTRRSSDSTGGSVVAGGIRITVLNGISFARHVVDLRSAVTDSAMDAFRDGHPQPDDPAGTERWDSLLDAYVDSVASDRVDNRIGALRDEYSDKWNHGTLDFAYAIALMSRDSFANELSPARHRAWVSGALPIGTWLQVMGGASGTYSRPDSLWVLDYTVAGRLVGGINEFRLNVGGQYKDGGSPDEKTWLVAVGAEAMVFSGGWVEFTINGERDIASGGTRFVPELKLRLTLPESFTKF